MNLSPAERHSAEKLMDAFQMFRMLYADMTVTQVVMLLATGARPGISQVDIHHLTGLTQASVSRNVKLLGQWGDRGTGPFFLLETRPDLRDRRLNGLFLTPRGAALVHSVLNTTKEIRFDRPSKE